MLSVKIDNFFNLSCLLEQNSTPKKNSTPKQNGSAVGSPDSAWKIDLRLEAKLSAEVSVA